MFVAFGLLSALLYAAASWLVIRRLRRGAAPGEADGAAGADPMLPIWGGAVSFHAATLYLHTFTPAGMDFGFFHSLSVIAWLAALIVLVSSFTRPMEILGVVLLPFAAVALLLEIAFRGITFVTPITDSGLKLHILVSLIAYSLLLIAAVQAALLAMQNRHLHEHHPGGFIRTLPPLAAMESLLFQVIGLGFALLSVSLASGFVFLDNIFAQHLVHKTALSIAAWAVFGILLLGRLIYGWRGRIAVRWTLGGFAALLLAYLGSKVVIELILAR